jgi:RNA polymerase sigma-54 factor
MALKINLNLNQSFKLSPNIEQSVHLLKSTEAELENLISEYLSKNPYLELDENDRNKIDSKKSVAHQEEEFYPSNFQNITLKDHLHSNLFDLGFDQEDLFLAQFIIDYIDDNGYLTEDYQFFIDEMYLEGIETNNEKIKEIIYKLNKISSMGIGARSLSECLLFQLSDFEQEDEILITKNIVENFLNILANKNFNQLSKELKVPIEDIMNSFNIIKKLNPKPGLKYGSNESLNYLLSDVNVRSINNELFIDFNNNYQSLKLAELPKEEISDIELFNQAKWFLKNINYRKINLIRIVKYIFKHHKKFIESKELDSVLTVKMTAKALELHESTVSRILSSKFVETPHGIFPLKFFFSHEINDSLKTNVLLKIKNIIDNEDKNFPLSDSKILLTLLEENITISRRTITKYREQLGILSATKRKG